MSFGGNLSTMAFPDILQWLSLGNKTGTLKITLGEEVRMVYLQKGLVISARSNRSKDHLGKLLLREGKITKEQIKQVLVEQKKTKDFFGVVCVKLGFLAQEELLEVVRMNTEEIIYCLFHLNQGEFVFQENELPETQLIPLSLTSNDLLMKGLRVKNEWAKINEALGGLDTLLEAAPIDIDLFEPTVMEKAILRALEEPKSAAAVCQESPVSDYETLKILHNFLNQGWVSKVTQEEVSSGHDTHSRDILAEVNTLVNECKYEEAIQLLTSLLDLFPDQSEANRLLEEAKRLMDKDLSKEVGSENSVPVLSVPLSSPILTEMKLSGQEGFLLSRIDGQTNIKTLAQILRLKKEELYRMLYRLKKANVIAIKGVSGPKKEATPPRSPHGPPLSTPSFGSLNRKKKPQPIELEAKVKALSRQDYYQILNIPIDANPTSIRERYFQLSREYHPDQFDFSDHQYMKEVVNNLFSAISEAYRTLINPDERRNYNRSIGLESTPTFSSIRQPLPPAPADNAGVQGRLGFEAYDKKQFEKALDHFRRASEMDPKDPQYIFWQAKTLLQIPQRFIEAERLLKKALDMDSTKAEYFALMGQIFEKADMKDRAMAAYERALEIEPKHGGSRRALDDLKDRVSTTSALFDKYLKGPK